MRLFCPLVVLTLVVGPCNALIYEHVSELPRQQFDFIIIGGGAAGNVLANRLSERSNWSVLVLEAGSSHKDAYQTKVPFYSLRLPGGQYDWGYSTTPQRSLNGRRVQYPRGFILGGSTSINVMTYSRGSSHDWDRYATVTGDQGWSWARIQSYLRKNERLTEPADKHDTTGQYDPRVHSRTGMVSVSLPNFPTGTDSILLQASKELPREFPFNLDMNSGNELGFGWTQSMTKNGARESSATSYLADKYLQRPNLSVLVNARVTKLMKTAQTAAGIELKGVEFTQDGGETEVILKARKEVILSAGSIGTPSILLHSGVGNSTTMRSLGITPILNLPSVGQNLTDHPLSSITWLVNSTDTYERLARNPALAAAAEAEWNATQTGVLSSPASNQLVFSRVPLNDSVFNGVKDPASGPTTPHFELLPFNGFFGPPPPSGNFFSILFCAIQPTSRGSVTISSLDPLAAPDINPNFLGTSFDLAVMREALSSSRRFVTAPVFKDYILNEVSNVGNTTDSINAFLRNSTSTVFHPTGTAMMTKKNAGYGVVDPDFRVKGAVGLRIVDASIFPFVPAGHTTVPTYVAAERAADIIKGAYVA